MKVLAIDQGTTATKSFTLDEEGRFESVAAFEHRQIYPNAGWVEHDPEELLRNVSACLEAAGKVDAIGMDNQGETVVAWDAGTGKPIYNAIVWQDSRTQDTTEKLKADGAEEITLARAGLPLDPYFSAGKLRWLLDHVDGARSLLKQGRLRLGTSDAFFLDRLTGTFATDVTTASRTSLMSLDTCTWDPELCKLFGVPIECLPEIRSTAGDFGQAGKIPVTASLVDQQAALFGHGCPTKITFGTGAFALTVTGEARVDGSKFGILPTLAWKIKNEPAQRAIEGGVYNAGSAVNWARGLGLFREFSDIENFELPSALSRNLVFVPALSGLACPHWDRGAAGLWIGMGLEHDGKGSDSGAARRHCPARRGSDRCDGGAHADRQHDFNRWRAHEEFLFQPLSRQCPAKDSNRSGIFRAHRPRHGPHGNARRRPEIIAAAPRHRALRSNPMRRWARN